MTSVATTTRNTGMTVSPTTAAVNDVTVLLLRVFGSNKIICTILDQEMHVTEDTFSGKADVYRKTCYETVPDDKQVLRNT